MLFTYALHACGFIYLSVAFDFEHSMKNCAVSSLRLGVQYILYSFILILCFLEILDEK